MNRQAFPEITRAFEEQVMTDVGRDEVLARTIERAFAEARKRGDPWAGSEHVLLALADGPPLSQVGATPERLRASVDTVLGPGVGETPYPVGVPASAAVNSAVARARAIATARGAARVTPSDILRGLLDADGHNGLVDLVLQHAGVDGSALRRLLA
jgi:ATP-dependent Clp protease ATP-binding subunit ClpA